MIYIVSDTHGLTNFPRIKEYFSHRYASKHDVLIILGDCGAVWSEQECFLVHYNLISPKVFFIDGNRENYTLLNQFPITEKFGAKVHYLARNVYHVLRGEVLQINGLSFLCLGGATSIDKTSRVPGVSWWEEEHIQDEEIDNAINNVKRIGGKVDYVLTHCAPSPTIATMFGYSPDEDTEKLAKLQRLISYDYWFFGHYHKDRTRGRFRCFYADILEIPAMKMGKRPIHQHLLTLEEDVPSPYLYHRKTGRRTSLTKDDLPEWFMENYAYRYWYYDLSGVTDVAYRMSPFDNHINKDSRIYLAYDGKHPKNKDQSPKNENDWEFDIWRGFLVEIIHGLEKYSPGLRLNPIKAQINLTYDQYNNGSMALLGNDVTYRPFPEVKTPRYRAKWGGELAQYEVYHGSRILSTFIRKEQAIAYVETYIKSNLRLNEIRYEESSHGVYQRSYDTGEDKSKWVYINAIVE